VVFTLVLFVPIVAAALAGRTGKVAFALMQCWAWLVLRVSGIRVVVRGRDNVETGRRYVILSNHQSHFDIPALVTSLGVPYRWVIKKELRGIPLFGYALAASRNIFIDRSNSESAMRSIQDGVAQLPEGTGVLFFPEGTRSWDDQMLPFKKGGFIAAQDSGLPILPVTVNGSRRLLPKGSAVFRSGTIEVVIHPPISARTVTEESLEELMERTRRVIASVRREP
jgi:1-acyl-sn-glycerol-3-phosphate acyltransferase